ncbi:DUF6146 family protein [Altibacter sp.]|uniref:DUF6146 family protein n=1 Tax=Altibacter sp. TaxID=2024823 RepID=UPI000C924EBD|nr:DUF6146 family protein [Altibacter sp.]MAP54830.1 hypothetical protein [Altibacter sp.]
MRVLFVLCILALSIYSCESGKSVMKGDTATGSTSDTIRIANDSLEYEILIIEPGFDAWLITQPPRSYYETTFLENRNYFYVLEYNNRVRNLSFSRALYPQEIEYRSDIDYGHEVNYLLYNYFQFFEQKYRQRLR